MEVKRIPLIVVIAWIVVTLPVPTSAQFLPAVSWGGFRANSGLDRLSGNPADIASEGWFKGYAGWMESYRDLRFTFDPEAGGGATGGSHRWRLSGLWIGAEKRMRLTDEVGLLLDGWCLFSAKGAATEQEWFRRTMLLGPFLGPDEREFFIPVTTPGTGGRSFDTRTDWWYLDAAGTYKVATSYFLMGGVRYEHFSVRFQNPGPGVGIPSGAGEEADVSVKSYVPYVGIQTVRRVSSGRFSSRFIAFPLVPARVTHFETGEAGTGIRTESKGHFTQGIFCEFFTNYDLNINDSVGIGVFIRWNYLTGKAALNTDVMGFSSANYEAVFTRNTYTLGAGISLAFTGF